MDCEQIRVQLNALVDGQLDAALRATVESHLSECADCRTARDTLQSLDGVLSQALRPIGRQSTAVADRAVARWQAEQPVARPMRFEMRDSARFLAAAAAGFLVAAMLFGQRPHPKPPVIGPSVAETSIVASDQTKPAVARVVLATGPLLFKADAASDWETVPQSQIPNFACPSDSCLRTEAAALCELVTPDGGLVRLNEKTEIALPAADEIALVGGQLWCQSAKDSPLRMTAAKPAAAETTWTCATESESLASLPPDGAFRILAVSGVVDVATEGGQQSLTSGMSCTPTDGELSVRQSSDEFLLASRWMQPLMTREGHANPELTRRVDAMLARIGRAKVSFLLEQDLRNLGEYGALPMLRYVQTAKADAERDRRQTAMRILSDTAPIWMVPDLIALLEDGDAQIRSSAAGALVRLTRETQGLTAEDWQSDRSRWSAGVTGWQAWWTQNSVSCSLPPAGVPSRINTTPSSESAPLLKARN
ncbi:MAG TPA: zf-HC2 domain-containing protein [Planctomycetaceae bacterium]|nr:zf-HC2 domain-containing protein [Planctomycetaceae bacterium]